MDVVWLKKDARLRDHAPLAEALSSCRPVLLLHVYEETDQLRHHAVHGSHVAFANEGLDDVEDQLSKIAGSGGRCITVMRGAMPEALDAICSSPGSQGIARILSHEETGHLVSYARDKRVKKWCKAHGVVWKEFQQNGVIRGLKNRTEANFANRWNAHMSAPLPPDVLSDSDLQSKLRLNLMRGFACHNVVTTMQAPEDLGLTHPEDRAERQKGGETQALALLHSFLVYRGEQYSAGISSPNSSWTSCCRLSPFFSFGHISLRYVVHALRQRQVELKAMQAEQRGPNWLRSLVAFQSRLRWRSHFMQKLETQPDIETTNQCRTYDHLRTCSGDWNEEYYSAWAEGRTGFPLVDACMRCLLKTGWVNFRMRAMLTSFAAYNLWLDWRGIAPHLGQCFLDYEPGIHYPQLQMQSGVTGINALRVYSVTKQALDQDPKGTFIRKFVPELELVPTKYVHEPWKMPGSVQAQARCRIGEDYPMPIVDEKETAKEAKARISAVSRELKTKAEAKTVYDRHGSRMGATRKKSSNGEYTEGHRPKHPKTAPAAHANPISKYLAKATGGLTSTNQQEDTAAVGAQGGEAAERPAHQEERQSTHRLETSAVQQLSILARGNTPKPQRGAGAGQVKQQQLMGGPSVLRQATLQDGWSKGSTVQPCPTCTFHNVSAARVCQMCMSPMC